jgi:hypothetical protein
MARFRSLLASLALSGILTLLSVAAALASPTKPPIPG